MTADAIPRCPEAVCVCTEQPGGVQPTTRDALLCLNAALKDRPSIRQARTDEADMQDAGSVGAALSRN
eukprot:3090696-Rhodomonas_salina.1